MDVHERRIERLRSRMRDLEVSAFIVAPGADLRYLTGYDALPLERPTLLVVGAEESVAVVAPRLEQVRVEHEVLLDQFEIQTYGEHDDALALAARRIRADQGARIAVGDQMWSAYTLGLQSE